MSHSKQTKRGFSLFVSKWNPSAKKYVNTCSICGSQGYSPVILELDFYDRNPNVHTEKRVIYEELYDACDDKGFLWFPKVDPVQSETETGGHCYTC